MIICSDIPDLRQHIRSWKLRGERIAFVPTMGNLHAGHLQLVAAARQQADHVVVSVFVNPMQFNDAADFNAYPRTLEQDADLLRAANVDVLFAPTDSVVYPHGQVANTKVIVPGLSDVLEGEYRPGHFTGVTTVVCKLFNIVLPEVALFGEKDFQQLLLIRRMVRDLDMPIQIASLPTVRESDGLAMSSRNGRLSAAERAVAPVLYQVLCRLRDQVLAGDRRYALMEEQAITALKGAGLGVEYVVVRRVSDLQPPQDGDQQLVVLVAAQLGKTRLIDNIPMVLTGK